MDLTSLIVVAADEISPDSFMAQIITPLSILVFLGSTYLLLRSNLGTRRGYYVLATCLFGFLFLMSLFWGFGAPGTPQATGPTHLPGQELDALLPKWVPFAQDSLLADRPGLDVVKQHPEGFGEPPEEIGDTDPDAGADEIQNFFASDAAGGQVGDDWAIVDVRFHAGSEVLAATYSEIDEDTLEPLEDGETYTGFAFYDEGNALLPSYIFILISLVLFVLHAWLLDRDERMERRALAATTAPERSEPARVPADA